MKVIIPMAGMGKRLRPLTLTTPKPLLKVAGKSIVEHLLNNLQAISPEPIDQVGFVIGNFSADIQQQIKDIAQRLGLKYHLFIQDVPLGTAHAVFMAKDMLQDNVIIAFADTIFLAKEKINPSEEAIIFTKKVENPEQYGVVDLDQNNFITGFVEKPKTFVSDQAIIGIYYFNQAQKLKEKIQYIIDNDIKGNGEYQLTDALSMLLEQGMKFKSYTTDEWLDCGNPQTLLSTTKRILEIQHNNLSQSNAIIENSVINPPVYIGSGAKITNSVIGPYASVEEGSVIENSTVKNSIIYDRTIIRDSCINDSIIGTNSTIINNANKLIVGDFTNIENHEK